MHNENMYNKMCNLSTEAMEKNCQTLYASQDFNIKLFFFFFYIMLFTILTFQMGYLKK